MKPQRTNKPPADGASPELVQLALSFLTKRYGSRPIDHDVMYWLTYYLGELERKYAKPPEVENGEAVASANGKSAVRKW